MVLIDKIKEKALENGAVLFGTAEIAAYLPQDLRHLPYAIAIGMRYPQTVLNGIKNGPTPEYFHQYRTINASLDRMGLLIQMMLLNEGHDALYIPASQSKPDNPHFALLSHKIAAVSAGLGFIGKSNLFISHEYGSGVRLMTVLTDMLIPSGSPMDSQCGACMNCVRACPSGAIFGETPKPPYRTTDIFSPEKCSYHMKENYQDTGRGSVCGICIANCPYTIK